jgi:hypothetical protein
VTKLELLVIVSALQDAEAWQHSLSEAYNHEGPESKKALSTRKKYKNLRTMLCDELGLDTKSTFEKMLESGETKSLKDMKDFYSKGFLP